MLCSVMAKEDIDAVKVLISQMESEGVKFVHHCTIESVTYDNKSGFELRYHQKQADGTPMTEVLQADAVLVAAGDNSLQSLDGLWW
jgi:pyruvate/2-oxoglutarate dehydrogenase complex dihydrolipoamide dehydrogenase (E3) component